MRYRHGKISVTDIIGPDNSAAQSLNALKIHAISQQQSLPMGDQRGHGGKNRYRDRAIKSY